MAIKKKAKQNKKILPDCLRDIIIFLHVVLLVGRVRSINTVEEALRRAGTYCRFSENLQVENPEFKDIYPSCDTKLSRV